MFLRDLLIAVLIAGTAFAAYFLSDFGVIRLGPEGEAPRAEAVPQQAAVPAEAYRPPMSAPLYVPQEAPYRSPEPSPEPPYCNIPQPQPDEDVFAVLTYEGAAVTNLILGEGDNNHLATINVELGDKPIYLILSAYDSTIFEITGAAQRVRKVLLLETSAERPLGVIGVDRARVRWSVCAAPFYDTDSGKGEDARQIFLSAIGKKPEAFVVNYNPASVSLPSGQIQKESGAAFPVRLDPTTLDDWHGAHPGGLRLVDPAQVVANVPISVLEVLPDIFGIAQLVELGALERLDHNVYRIVQPIPHYPPNLYGAFYMRFVLAGGVPEPSGHPGHSCLVYETSSQPSKAPCDDHDLTGVMAKYRRPSATPR
jgi:hypothetical protein